MQHTYTGTITDIRQETPTTKCFTLQTPSSFTFTPGQYILTMYRTDTEPLLRQYSPLPRGSDSIELCMKIVPHRRFTTIADQFTVGQSLQIIGPFGDFVLQSVKQPITCVATGTGVSTIRAIIDDAFHNNIEKPVTLIHGVKNEEELVYREHFEQLQRLQNNFAYLPILSEPAADWRGHTGYVQDMLPAMLTAPETTHLYICGLPAMVNSVRQLAITQLGIPTAQVFMEKY